MKEKKSKEKKVKKKTSTTYYITAMIYLCVALLMFLSSNDSHMMGIVFLSLGVTWLSLASTHKTREEKREKAVAYYNEHAAQYVGQTFGVDMSEHLDRFTMNIPENGVVLDWGCGSGRDSLAMMKAGFQVEATELSEELCKLATEKTGIEVRHEAFDDLKKRNYYDGIWACASLLHVNKDELGELINRAQFALKENGVMYISFKYGNYEGERDGRFFKDWTEESFADMIKYHKKMRVIDSWVSQDARGDRKEQKWLNIILQKRSNKK